MSAEASLGPGYNVYRGVSGACGFSALLQRLLHFGVWHAVLPLLALGINRGEPAHLAAGEAATVQCVHVHMLRSVAWGRCGWGIGVFQG